MRSITARPATPLTLLGVLFWTPNTQLLGFGVRGATWIGTLVLLIPYTYCVYRLLRAPLDRGWWVTGLASLALGLLGTVGLISSLTGRYIAWQEVIWAMTVFACFAYAARNWMAMRTESDASFTSEPGVRRA